MLDIRQFREQPELIKAAIAKRGGDTEDVERVRGLDERLRALKTEAESKKAELNAATKQMGAQMKTLSGEEKETRRAELRAVGDAISGMDALRADVEKTLQTLMLEIPNIPRDDVPVGADEHSNVVTRSEGKLKTFDFTPRPHWELGASLGILDIERGIKISGSRFYVLKGMGAALQRALIAYMLDMHIQKHGYEEIYPPFVVKQECLYGTTQLPKFADNLYHDVEDDFWMVPTAEVPVTNLHRDEILDAVQLPVSYVAYTPCFRREKMSSGRDVRGIKRGHQFDKVEMVKLTTPQTSDAELVKLLDNAEDVCRGLDLPYRIVLQSTGDLSFGSNVTFDVEIYAPASKGDEGGEWLEVSSCSNFRDFQARRINLRYRPEPQAKPEFVHTLNGSGLALPRVLIGVLENYQNADGSVTIPPALRPYLHNRKLITPA